jgi:hypothetical protein
MGVRNGARADLTSDRFPPVKTGPRNISPKGLTSPTASGHG